MSEPNWNVFVIRALLLGQLSEAEGAKVRLRRASDPAYATFIASVEEELAADYVRGRLSDTDRRAFEIHYVQSGEHAANVQFARVLAKSMGRERRAARHKVAGAFALLVLGVAAPIFWIQARTVTADLYPGIQRGAGTGSSVRIERLTATIRLRLHLPRDVKQAPATLRQIGSADILTGVVDSCKGLATWRVPAALLHRGDYVIQVSRDSPDAETFLLHIAE